MKTPISKDDHEFYVGYLPTMPRRTATVMRNLVYTIGLLVILAATLIGFNQIPFSTAAFEYGEPTTLKGELVLEPVPHMEYVIGTDVDGRKLSKTVLLVGAGKFGGDQLVQELRRKYRQIDRHNVVANGYLIYGDGKLLLQMTDVTVTPERSESPSASILPLGKQQVTGEIVDPKCFFGVMKPGQGKAHRDCAIRCIAGGMPPVLKVTGGKYLLLTGEAGEAVNGQVLSLVGDQITISGELLAMNDWLVLRVTRHELDRISLRKKTIQQLLSNETMTFCVNE